VTRDEVLRGLRRIAADEREMMEDLDIKTSWQLNVVMEAIRMIEEGNVK